MTQHEPSQARFENRDTPSDPVVSKKTYALVYLSLLALTGLTTGLAYIDLGPFNTVVAIGLAIVKASLIAAFFMHVIYEFKLVWVILAGALVWFCLLMITLSDYFTRGWTKPGAA